MPPAGATPLLSSARRAPSTVAADQPIPNSERHPNNYRLVGWVRGARS